MEEMNTCTINCLGHDIPRVMYALTEDQFVPMIETMNLIETTESINDLFNLCFSSCLNKSLTNRS